VVAESQAALGASVGEQRVDLEAVYREHAPMVKRWAQRLGGPSVDLEDVVHEVFLVAHRRLRTFHDGGGSIATWLYRTTMHITYKHLRKQRVGRWLRGLGGEPLDEARSPDPGPLERLERQQSVRTVYRALEGLNRNHRAVVILYEIEGLSGEEIATLMNTKLATVWVWLHRGRAKFLERLKALGEEGAR
jgi:RNA polymerase sigma-70 factor, ECF subfamily